MDITIGDLKDIKRFNETDRKVVMTTGKEHSILEDTNSYGRMNCSPKYIK